MHTFGSSAPLKDVMNEFGFTPDKVADAARGAIERAARNETSN
jgi:transketolase